MGDICIVTQGWHTMSRPRRSCVLSALQSRPTANGLNEIMSGGFVINVGRDASLSVWLQYTYRLPYLKRKSSFMTFVEGELRIKVRDVSYIVVCVGKRLLETKCLRRHVPLKPRYTPDCDVTV